MDLSLSAEQEQLRETAVSYLQKQTSQDEDTWDAAGWSRLADLGWLDSELTLLDEVVLLEAAAAALLPAPMFSTRLVLPLLDPDTRDAVENGSMSVALAWAEPGRPTELTLALDSATLLDRDSGRVSGHKVLVPDADKVDRLIVATGGPQPSLSMVAASDARITTRSTSDLTRALSDVVLEDVAATPIELQGEVADALAALRQRAYVFSAAEALGVGSRALNLALDHVGERTQFGRRIGTFQAVSHQLVNAHIDLELGRSLTYWAAHCVESTDPRQVGAAPAAKAHTTTAAVRACEAAIQVFGGVGMTWEHPLHRLYKRAQWLEAYLVDARGLYDVVADSAFASTSATPSPNR